MPQMPTTAQSLREWVRLTFGLSGRNNVLAWGMSAGVAYYLWVYPEQKVEAERKAYHDAKIKEFHEKGMEKFKEDMRKRNAEQAAAAAAAGAAGGSVQQQ